MSEIEALCHILVGRPSDEASEYLVKRGYKVRVKTVEPKKDKELLTDELVTSLKAEDDESITIITSKFKKYI